MRLLRITSVLAMTTIAGYAVLAMLAYQRNASPREQIRDARRTLGDAFAELESSSGQPAAEIDAFAEQLRYAQRAYRSAALGDVLGGEAVLGLAATQCELGQIDRGDGGSCAGLLAIAEGREPRNGSYQLRVADAWFSTGHPSRGSRIAAHAVALNPVATSRALRLLTRYGLTPAASVEALGRRADVLAAARDHFTRSEGSETYLDLVESVFPECTSSLLESYGETALRLRQFGRLIERLEPLGTCEVPDAEAMRLKILAQALLAAGRIADATPVVASARTLRPGDPRIIELQGDCEASAAGHRDAAATYRLALREAARSSASKGQRARLYRKIGQCHEAMGEGGLAFDAYSKSLELNPDESIGKARLRELTRRAPGAPR